MPEGRGAGPAARALNPALAGEFAGALHCRQDAIVEPRAAAALRAHLARSADYTWLPGREAVAAAPRAVRDHTGQWHRGDLVVVCSGAAYTGLAAGPCPRSRRWRAATGPSCCWSSAWTAA